MSSSYYSMDTSHRQSNLIKQHFFSEFSSVKQSPYPAQEVQLVTYNDNNLNNTQNCTILSMVSFLSS